MSLFNKSTLALLASGVALSAMALPAHADISILDQNEFNIGLLDPLSLGVGGSIRPEFIWQNGKEPGYYKNGHDGGTRLHATANYQFNSHTALIGYYEIQANLFHIVDWDNHYEKGSKRTFQRQLYAGIQDDRYGTLTWGHQYGVYYDLVGGKSDMWDNDGYASANWIGYDGDYDGGERPKSALKYANTWGKWTIEADWLMPEDDAVAGDDGDTGDRMLLRRNHGGAIGAQYAFQDDLTLGVAYNQNRMTVKDSTQSRKYNQQFVGSALTWTPGNWYLVTTATYYKHYVPTHGNQTTRHFFAGDGYGLEAFGGYTFHFDKPMMYSIQPYLATDTLRLKGGENYHGNRTYIGVNYNFTENTSVALERTIANTSDDVADTTYMTFYLNF